MPDEHLADAVLLAEPQRYAAAGAAVTDSVEIAAALDDGVYEPSFVAVP